VCERESREVKTRGIDSDRPSHFRTLSFTRLNLPTLSFTHTDSLSLSLSARAYMTDEGMRCAHMTDEVMRCAHMADEGMGKEKGIIFFLKISLEERCPEGVHAL
jgi:hypothetical protein